MKKVRFTKELAEKANAVFKVKKQIRTNEDLSRAELRCLKRNGILTSKMFNGVNVWFIDRASIDGMIGKFQ